MDWHRTIAGQENDWIWGSAEMRAKVSSAVEPVRLTLSKGCPNVEAGWHGVIGINPRHVGIWFMTNLDAARDAILAEGKLTRLIQASFRKVNYPAEAVLHISRTVESQETVDRVYGGRWHNRMR